MKHIYLVLATVLLLTSCDNKPISREHLGKDEAFMVEYLFEKDGIKVYRFEDGNRTHYFTTGGNTMSTYQSGKSSYAEEINRY